MTQFNIKQASSKTVEFNTKNFAYGSDWRKALSELAVKIAKSNNERLIAFNSIAHVAFAEATQGKTQKVIREQLAKVRDDIEQALGKQYSKAFALACQEMEFSLPEQAEFEALDFSAFVGQKVQRAKKEPEHGIPAMIKSFQNRKEKLQKMENPAEWVGDEIAAYTLIISLLKESPKAKQ